MPVAINLTDYRTKSKDVDPVTSPQILEGVCPDQFRQAGRILQYSIGGGTRKRGTRFKIIPNGCGFVHTVLSAYTGHHALVLRPDDIWLTVISQFSLYVNANPELLGDRTNSVSHEPGRGRPLVIVDTKSFPLSTQMGELMQQNVLDPALREWILPNFSTSTPHDVDIAVMSMLRMTPTAKQVSLPGTKTLYRGIPRVTLEGFRKDWELLLHKLEKLKEYGIPAIAWYHLLYPVLSQITMSFYTQNAAESREFWKRVVHWEGFGGGSSNLSGWITAFSLFSCEGKCRIPQLRTTRLGTKDPADLPPHRFWSIYAPSLQETSFNMTIDGTKYPVINIHDLPTGYAEVRVMANHEGIAAPCMIVAGLTGVGFGSSRDTKLSCDGKNDTVRPVVAWWMFSNPEQARLQSLEHEPAVLSDSGDGLSPALDGNPVPPSFVLAASA
ncbi:hypothetical protein MSAN_02286700 [Mycena sanguinolenta]|uniref:Uncharacterized protein n=1 Tax=Mycena sanguinolenta TaxID=230812 RepID=A0A8H6X9P1_9AGAR|nr:hypothetical protein MSAN_02286700 [Mycena sanguinolenta]